MWRQSTASELSADVMIRVATLVQVVACRRDCPGQFKAVEETILWPLKTKKHEKGVGTPG